jgi:hypothetical protein
MQRASRVFLTVRDEHDLKGLGPWYALCGKFSLPINTPRKKRYSDLAEAQIPRNVLHGL